MAASHHGDTPYSGNSVTSLPVTPYTTSVDVNKVWVLSDVHRAEHPFLRSADVSRAWYADLWFDLLGWVISW